MFNDELVDLAYWMSRMYLCAPGEALSVMLPAGRRESESALFAASDEEFRPIENLHSQQQAAIDRIKEKTGLYYLFGVTGSGKSEVYLRLAEEVVSAGGQVIYLVPEITLTHQLREDVEARFEGKVAILHSALTPSQRLKEWMRIARNEASLIIGARSAIFAPCPNLKLIIMDEEHENSYKSGNTPRYHARQVAQYRASRNKISLVMGSATPSLEAWNMMRKGKVEMIRMPEKVAGGFPARIDIVNMLKESRSISRYLEGEIRETLSRGRGVILFLNRRGYTYYYHCNSCGHVFECPNCSVALTYHKKDRHMRCHYCGYTEEAPDICPECGSTDLSVSGFGTERVEEEVRRLFPSAKIARLDTDVAGGDKEVVRKIIDDFRDGKLDILLGTQMVAKGLNFPTVSLVGVILADSTLSVPDFRAEERTFSLLEQVSGRCGRYRDDGHVVIQTCRVEDAAINAVRDHSLERFYEREMGFRKQLSYPPFSRFVLLVARSKSEEKSRVAAEELASIISKELRSGMTLIGCGPCIIEKKAASYRHQILLSSDNVAALNEIISRALEAYKKPSGVYIEVDVDPLCLL